MRKGNQGDRRAAWIAAAGAAVLFAVLSFPCNYWLSLTMPRHQAIQLPAMLLIGLVVGRVARKVNVKDFSWGLALLLLAMGSLIFWMLPRSIDLAVIHPWFNRTMHVHMVATGFAIAITLRNMPFELKIAFPGMLAGMLIATGASLRAFTILLCSSFTIEQQHETGFWLMAIGVAVFLGTAVFFVRGLGRE